jgi:glutathione synthase/RimK-type ligase-like ATP-grasp enzyme
MASKPKILIIYPKQDDPQATILYEEILNKGGHPVLMPFDLKNTKFSVGSKSVFPEGMDDIKAVFIRGISTQLPLAFPPYMNEMEASIWRARYLKENYKIQFLSSWLRALEQHGVMVVNPIRSYLHHNTKTQFFQLLAKNGISVPNSYGTNDLDYLRNNNDIELVCKAACGVGATKSVTKDEVIKEISLKKSPGLFQERIYGNTVRVHTVGDKAVLSLRILASDVDSRSDTKGFEVINLTQEQEAELVNANRLLGLKFTAWDVIIDENGKIFLLDCNPGPYIYWIGGYFTRLVKAELAKYLVTFAETGSLEQAELSTSKPKAMVGGIHKIPDEAHHLFDDSFDSWKDDLGLRY